MFGKKVTMSVEHQCYDGAVMHIENAPIGKVIKCENCKRSFLVNIYKEGEVEVESVYSE